MLESRDWIEAASYLTDEQNLYRLLGPVGPDARGLVGLEDCRSLDVVLVSFDDLWSRSMRAVTPAAQPGTAVPLLAAA